MNKRLHHLILTLILVGLFLVTSGCTGVVNKANIKKAFDIELYKRHKTLEPMKETTVNDADYVPSGDRIVSGQEALDGRRITLWVVSLGQPTHGFTGADNLDVNGEVFSVSVSSSGERVAVASDEFAELWDVSSGDLVRTFDHGDFFTDVLDVTFVPPEKLILTGSRTDTGAILWDTETGKPVRAYKHKADVKAVASSPSGDRLATVSCDKYSEGWIFTTCSEASAKLWQRDSDEPVRQFGAGEVAAVVFSSSGDRVFTGGNRGARLWEVESGNLVQEFRANTNVNDVAISPDGKRVLTGSSDNAARLWNVRTGEVIDTLETDAPVNAVAFSPSGEQILTATNVIKLWEPSEEAIDAAGDQILEALGL